MAKTSDSEYTLTQFAREFPNDDACLEWLWLNRYSQDGTHAYCPKCEQEREFKRYKTTQQRQSWTCIACGNHIHPTAGTIFHKSSTSLALWFYAMYLMTSTRCGISAKQLERELGVTYKTAYRIATQIRKSLMAQTEDKLGKNNCVELDETYVGGKVENMHLAKRKQLNRRGVAGKQPVFGAVERKGKVLALTVQNTDGVTLLPHVTEHVIQAAKVYTDEMGAYKYLNEHVLTTENLAKLVHMVNEEMDSLAVEYRQRLDSIFDEITDVDHRLERLYDALETGKIQIADLAPRIQQLRLRQQQLKATRLELEQDLSDRRVELADAETVARCVVDLRNLLTDSSLAERKSFVRSFVKEVKVTGEEGLLTYTIPMLPKGVTEERLPVLSIGHDGGQ